MKKMKRFSALAIAAVLILSAALLTGCGAVADTVIEQTAAPEAAGPVGTLLLTVNPEIEISYDAEGCVVAAAGLNDDGASVIAACPDIAGQKVEVAAGELTGAIYDGGYFETTINGNAKNVVLKLVQSSVLPSDDYLASVAASVETAIAEHDGKSEVVTVSLDEYNADYEALGYMSVAKAEEIALRQVGASDEAYMLSDAYAISDAVYTVLFADGERAYEIGVNAVSGKIVAAQSALLSDIIDDATPGNAGVGGNGGQANNGVSGGDGNVNWHDDDTWEDWGESVGDYWENWGESVGDYFDKKFDF